MDTIEEETGYVIRCSRKCISPVAATFIAQQRIRNLVRVPSSLYTMNNAAINVYQPSNEVPSNNGVPYNGAAPCNKVVQWNQMSDRVAPAVQPAYVSFRSSKSLRPGALTPGGVGCDIKHNSYERRLLKLKGGIFRNKSRVAGGCI
jgi:hypothetical protein